MNEKKPLSREKSKRSFDKSSKSDKSERSFSKSSKSDKSERSFRRSSKSGNSQKPYKSGSPANKSGFKKLQGKKGAQQGDYIIISDGKKKVTTRINLSSHPFAKKEVGDMVYIKGVEWYLIRIIHQGTAAYNEIYDADTQREHFGY